MIHTIGLSTGSGDCHLLLATGCKAALIDLQPWYSGPDADPIRQAINTAKTDLTTRANHTPETRS